MSKLDNDPAEYPGTSATSSDIFRLAEVYADAAKRLLTDAQKGQPLTYAPARLCAIHAIELFLNAFLRSEGVAPGDIRGRLHDLSEPQFIAKLRLRTKTARHLKDMTHRREYLISRYAPDLTSQHTELNRLTASLNEIHTKTRRFLNPPPD